MTKATDMSKGRLVIALIVLFLSSMCTMGDLVINPIVSNLYEVFAGSPEWLINLGITGPALVGLPFGLIAGVLCDRMDKKWIMVIGFAIFTVTACFGAAITNIYYFVTMRLCATGVGWGITNTAAMSILADLFPDDDEHGKYVGWYSTVMSILGAVMAAVAGVLAINGWQNAFMT
ncbi:MAG: MFS transporter, partial [Coriobacteriales bacterium]